MEANIPPIISLHIELSKALMNDTVKYPSLNKQSVFITGGATGIGASMVEAFCQQGADVSFIDINENAANSLLSKLSDLGYHRPRFRKIDVTDADQLQTSISDTAAEIGTINTLVNNVANDSRHQVCEMTQKRWRECMAVNLDSCFFASQTASEFMRKQATGSIINLSSINAILGPRNMAGYVTAKAGINGMTKALAKDFGDANIRVNAILPGWVATDRQLETWLDEESETDWSRQVAIKQRLQENDVAQLALFLAADESRMITGQCIAVDAGRT